MIDLLLKLATPALLFADDPKRSYWHVHLVLYTVFVWAVDVVLAHTLWAYYFGLPRAGELTISDTLERLCVSNHPRGIQALALALRINSISPGHIKAVKDANA